MQVVQALGRFQPIIQTAEKTSQPMPRRLAVARQRNATGSSACRIAQNLLVPPTHVTGCIHTCTRQKPLHREWTCKIHYHTKVNITVLLERKHSNGSTMLALTIAPRTDSAFPFCCMHLALLLQLISGLFLPASLQQHLRPTILSSTTLLPPAPHSRSRISANPNAQSHHRHRPRSRHSRPFHPAHSLASSPTPPSATPPATPPAPSPNPSPPRPTRPRPTLLRLVRCSPGPHRLHLLSRLHSLLGSGASHRLRPRFPRSLPRSLGPLRRRREPRLAPLLARR